MYFTSLMFRQHTPKPARLRDVSPDPWLRTSISASRNTPAFHIVTLAGGPTSSAGVP
jgi:hypothetical protein